MNLTIKRAVHGFQISDKMKSLKIFPALKHDGDEFLLQVNIENLPLEDFETLMEVVLIERIRRHGG